MIDLTGRTDVPVPEEVLAEVSRALGQAGLDFLVIGAAARDLAIHSLQNAKPLRATLDVDIAIAVPTQQAYEELGSLLSRTGRSAHTFNVLGVEVDIVPFGGIERNRSVRFNDDHLLDVSGLQEVSTRAERVRMPRGTEVWAASAPAQAVLKILAWRDRHDGNRKDGPDLALILAALSEDPFVDEVWDDSAALDATDDDILSASCFHYGRIAGAPFSPADGTAVLDVLHDPSLRPALERQMGRALAVDMLDGFARGFERGMNG